MIKQKSRELLSAYTVVGLLSDEALLRSDSPTTSCQRPEIKAFRLTTRFGDRHGFVLLHRLDDSVASTTTRRKSFARQLL